MTSFVDYTPFESCEGVLWQSVVDERKMFWKWDFRWRRGLFVWEEELLTSLLQIISSVRIQRGKSGSWAWTVDLEGVYSVKATYLVLTQDNMRPACNYFKKIRASPVPS